MYSRDRVYGVIGTSEGTKRRGLSVSTWICEGDGECYIERHKRDDREP